MILDLAAMLTLAAQCAPNVAPATLTAIAQTESGLDPLAIGVNGRPGRALRPRTSDEAIATARRRIAAGDNLDLGVAQINHRNLPWLNLTLEGAFDTCSNLAAAGRLLAHDYHRARQGSRGEQDALRVALSRYNTGDDRRGFANGYVGKVEAAARGLGPATLPGRSRSAHPPSSPSAAPTGDPPTADVFARSPATALVFVASDGRP